MAKRKAKKEVVLCNLINDSREIVNLLAVGKADEQGVFPNKESNFVLRKLRMSENKHANWRGANLYEMTIPRSVGRALAYKITQVLNQPDHELKAGDFNELPSRKPVTNEIT